MVSTRSKTRSAARHTAFKRSYQGLTPSQQTIARHNRFLARVWKIPWDKRQQNRTCVACLEDFLTGPQRSHMVIMACDHPIHMECLERHTIAYMDRQNLTFSAEELDAMPVDEVMVVFKKRWLFTRCGAPCPVCRTPFPMGHMCVFE